MLPSPPTILPPVEPIPSQYLLQRERQRLARERREAIWVGVVVGLVLGAGAFWMALELSKSVRP